MEKESIKDNFNEKGNLKKIKDNNKEKKIDSNRKLLQFPIKDFSKKKIEKSITQKQNDSSNKIRFKSIAINLQKQFDEIPTNAESLFPNLNYNENEIFGHKDLISGSSQSNSQEQLKESQQTLIDELKEKLNVKCKEIDKEDFIEKKKKIYCYSNYEYIPNITFENNGEIFSFKLYSDKKIGFDKQWNSEKLYENHFSNDSDNSYDEKNINDYKKTIFDELKIGINYIKSKKVNENLKDFLQKYN